MRSITMARTPLVAAALALLLPGVVSAQSATPPPDDLPGVRTSVVTNALDPSSTNSSVEQTAQDFHLEVGGKPKSWTAVPPRPGASAVIDAVLDEASREVDLVVISGGDGQADVGIAREFELTFFIDVGQPLPCVTEGGKPDDSGTCAGGELRVPPNYMAVDFAVEDGAYLAGLLAAAASRNDRLGIISGTPDCTTCNRFIQGFVNGARSVEPEIDIQLAYLADDEVDGFGDPVSARTFAEAFIEVYQPDVLLPVGRAASTGMIEAACEDEAGAVLAIGAGIDVAATNPQLEACVLTSISLDMGEAVNRAMQDFANGERRPLVEHDLSSGLMTISWPRQTLPVDTAERYQAAETGIRSGQIETCADDCGAAVELDGANDVPVEEPAADGE